MLICAGSNSSFYINCLKCISIFQLQQSEDVHVMVQPGNYSVTTGTWGSQQQQTHVVHVEDGQTVDLDFVVS